MRTYLTSKSESLGSTPTGGDWCLKALHPADPLVEVRGLPDKSAVPSAFINYQAVFTVSPVAGAAGTWSLDASLLPEPIALMSLSATDSVGIHNSVGLNPQLTGATYGLKSATFAAACQRWRLCYASVTATQDGPDLANQGTVVVCQKTVAPFFRTFGAVTAGNQALVGLKDVSYTNEDHPDYTSAQAYPNSYFAQSKYGVYAPMKLTRTCQRWQAIDIDRSLILGSSAASAGTGTMVLPPATLATQSWPYYGFNQDAYNPVTDQREGESVLDWGNDVVPQVSFRNLAVTTSITFFVRMGIEIQCTAGSIYSPQLRLSPPHDSHALKMYFAIAREMKDAYPADYNDLAKIWGVIKNILSYVAPAIGMIPHPVAKAIAAGIPAGVGVVSAIEKSFSKTPGNKGTPSAGAVEQARAQMAAVRARRTPLMKPQ